MEVKQVYELANTITSEVLGKENPVNEDLSNIVDVGEEVVNSNNLDNYVKSLVDRIGRVIFVNRPYSGSVPSLLMDGWEYGSIMEKIQADIPEATENETWELVNGTSYDPNIFYQPKVTAEFFNKRMTFETNMSFTEKQVKESFANAEQLNGFMSMLYNSVDRSMTIKIDGLVMRTINNAIASTVSADYGTDEKNTKSGIKAVNLLYLYNQKYGTTLTPVQALTTPEFIRFASYIIGLYRDRLSRMSTLFNIGGKERFTPYDLQHLVLLSDFEKSAGVYLYDGNGQFSTENIKLPNADVVPYWQGSGTDYSFENVSAINVKTAKGDTVSITGVLGVLFDRDSMGITNYEKRVTTNYNPKAEFYSNFYKFECGAFNSQNEQVVVFFVA